jgi:hypothetical protein
MAEFIIGVIATVIKYLDARPGHIHKPSQIFWPVTDKILTQDMLRTSDEVILEKFRGLWSSLLAIQMGAGTLLRHHFLNYVVSRPGLRPFLFHTEFHDTFAQVDYSTIITTAVEQLLEKGVVVAGMATDNLFCQQLGLRLVTESAIDPRIEGLIIVPCLNHILNLVLRNSIKRNEEFAAHIESIKLFQGMMRKNAAIRQYWKVCPDFPETRWMYVCGACNWIVTERDELIPFVFQCTVTHLRLWRH